MKIMERFKGKRNMERLRSFSHALFALLSLKNQVLRDRALRNQPLGFV